VAVAALLRQFADVFGVIEFQTHGIFTERDRSKLRMILKRIDAGGDGQIPALCPEAGMAGDAALVDGSRETDGAFVFNVTFDAGGGSHLLGIVQRGVVAGGALDVGDADADTGFLAVAIGAVFPEEGM
jgi:hypothetical protein